VAVGVEAPFLHSGPLLASVNLPHSESVRPAQATTCSEYAKQHSSTTLKEVPESTQPVLHPTGPSSPNMHSHAWQLAQAGTSCFAWAVALRTLSILKLARWHLQAGRSLSDMPMRPRLVDHLRESTRTCVSDSAAPPRPGPYQNGHQQHSEGGGGADSGPLAASARLFYNPAFSSSSHDGSLGDSTNLHVHSRPPADPKGKGKAPLDAGGSCAPAPSICSPVWRGVLQDAPERVG
jgi:hypothetical protein